MTETEQRLKALRDKLIFHPKGLAQFFYSPKEAHKAWANVCQIVEHLDSKLTYAESDIAKQNLREAVTHLQQSLKKYQAENDWLQKRNDKLETAMKLVLEPKEKVISFIQARFGKTKQELENLHPKLLVQMLVDNTLVEKQ